MELLCARIGSNLNYCHPYTPTAKAKIECAFLPEIEKTVSADSGIDICHTEYEVDYRFAKRCIRLRYSQV